MAITARRTETSVNVQASNQLRVREQDVSSGLESIARGMDNVGDVVSNEAIRVKVKEDDTAVLDAFNQTQVGHNARFEGENGYKSLKGKDSFTALSDASQYLQASKDEVGKMLANDRQREKFAAMMEQSNQGRMVNLTKHVQVEKEVYQEGVYNATITSELGRVVDNANDPDIRDDALFNVEIAIRTKMQGQSEAAINEVIQKVTEHSNGQVLLQLVETDFNQAKDFLAKHHDDLTVETRNAVGAKIKQKEQQQKAFANADKFIKSSDNEEDALGKAANIKDVEVRQATERRVRLHYQDERRVEQEAQTELSNDLNNKLEDALTSNDIGMVQLLIASEDNFKRRNDMAVYAQNYLKGVKVDTNVDVEARVVDMIATPSAYDESVLKYMDDNRSKMSDSDFIAYRQKFRDIQNSTKKDKAAKRVVTEFTQLRSSYSALYPVPVAKDSGSVAGKKRIEKYNAFKNEYQTVKDIFFKEHKREPDTAEAQTMMDRALVQVVIGTEGFFFDSDVKVSRFELSKLTPDDIDYDVIPQDYKSTVINIMRKHGRPATEEAVKLRWLNAMRGY